jgi:hypothetical protein
VSRQPSSDEAPPAAPAVSHVLVETVEDEFTFTDDTPRSEHEPVIDMFSKQTSRPPPVPQANPQSDDTETMDPYLGEQAYNLRSVNVAAAFDEIYESSALNPQEPVDLSAAFANGDDFNLYRIITNGHFDHADDPILLEVNHVGTDSAFAPGCTHFDDGAQASTIRDQRYLHGYKAFTAKRPCPARLICASGVKHIPVGYGFQLHRDTDGNLVPIFSFHTPSMPCEITSPSSVYKGRPRQNWTGYTTRTFEDTKRWCFTLHHRRSNQRNITLCGQLYGELKYTNPMIPVDSEELNVSDIDKLRGPQSMLKAVFALEIDYLYHQKEEDLADMTLAPLFQQPSEHDEPETDHMVHGLRQETERLLWHQRLGHCSDWYLYNAHRFSDGVPQFKHHTGVLDKCPTCIRSKIRKANSSNRSTRRASIPGQGFSLDFGFIGQASKDEKRTADFTGLHGETCYLLIADHFTGELFGAPRISKAVPVELLRHFFEQRRPRDHHDLHLRVDQGGELYQSNEFKDLCKEYGYVIEPTGADASNQNAPVERPHQTIGNALRTMLHGAQLPNCFWPYAFDHYLRIKNTLPRKSDDVSPITQRTGKTEDLRHLKTFGCRVWVRPTHRRSHKLDLHARCGVFLGYIPNTYKNIIWYDVESCRVKIARHAVFDEAMNDLDASKLPPNVKHLHRAQLGTPLPATSVEVTADDLHFVDCPFEDVTDKKLTITCKHPLFGLTLATDELSQRVYISDIAQRSSASLLCSSLKATKRKHLGAFIIAINDEPVFHRAEAIQRLELLRTDDTIKTIQLTLASDRRPDAATRNRQARDHVAYRPPSQDTIVNEVLQGLDIDDELMQEILLDNDMLLAIHRLRYDMADSAPVDTPASMDIPIHSLQSETMTDAERALPKLTRRRLQTLDTWPLWKAAEHEQLDKFYALPMWGKPQLLPKNDYLLLHPTWQNRVKTSGRRRMRYCMDGSVRRAPALHKMGHTYASCIEQPLMRTFFALCALENHLVFGADAVDAFAHTPAPPGPTRFISLCPAFIEWWKERFNEDLDPRMALPLLRVLQGDPAAGRLWEAHINAILRKCGFTNTTHEKNLYRATIDGHNVLLCRQVDDFALGAPSATVATQIFNMIGIGIQVPGEAKPPLIEDGIIKIYNGVDVQQTRDYIKLHGTSYIRRLLIAHGWDKPGKHEHETARPTSPLPPADVEPLFRTKGFAEHTPEHQDLEKHMGFAYRTLLGELMYAYVIGRLDIGYAITLLAQFSAAPAAIHYHRLRGVAKYLRKTIDWGLVYWRIKPRTDLPLVPLLDPPVPLPDDLPAFPDMDSPFQFVSFVDAAHANSLYKRRSTTGHCMALAGAAVSFKASTQKLTATSSTEAEFIAAVSAGKQVKYLRAILRQLGYRQLLPTPIYGDNKSSIQMINAQKPTERSRHIDIQHFAIQDWQENGDLTMRHIPGVINCSDDLTKALGWVLHSRHARRMMGHYGPPRYITSSV